MTNSNDSSSANTGDIAGVANFVQRILDYRNSPQWAADYIHFFRGHADKENFELQPSLFRDTALLEKEDVLFREIIASNPSDFADDRSTFDKLVRMQHYGMPTRLLDITTNPLVALYFACVEFPNIDGDVIMISVHRDAVKFFDCDTTSVIANLARMGKDAKDKVKEHAEKAITGNDDAQIRVVSFNAEEEGKEEQVHRLIHFIRDEKPFFQPKIDPVHIDRIICVKSKMSNLRISSQAGAFLLFGHGAVLEEKEGNGTEWFKIQKISIPGKNKITIRKELDLLDINESTVFADIEYSAKYIKAKYINPKCASGK